MYGSAAGGRGFLRAYECVDVRRDLESCGGCVYDDSPFGERSADGGRDCSAIPFVDAERFEPGRYRRYMFRPRIHYNSQPEQMYMWEKLKDVLPSVTACTMNNAVFSENSLLYTIPNSKLRYPLIPQTRQF